LTDDNRTVEDLEKAPREGKRIGVLRVIQGARRISLQMLKDESP
jgi:hypothetical protein